MRTGYMGAENRLVALDEDLGARQGAVVQSVSDTTSGKRATAATHIARAKKSGLAAEEGQGGGRMVSERGRGKSGQWAGTRGGRPGVSGAPQVAHHPGPQPEHHPPHVPRHFELPPNPAMPDVGGASRSASGEHVRRRTAGVHGLCPVDGISPPRRLSNPLPSAIIGPGSSSAPERLLNQSVSE